MTNCQGCDAETTTGYLCPPCRGRLEWLLAEVDATMDDLDTTLTRQARTGTIGAGGRSAETPLAYHAGASDEARALRDLLKDQTSYVLEKLADEGRMVAPPMPATAQRLASFLLTHLDWVAAHDIAGDNLRELDAAIKACRRVIDLAPDLVTLGVCGGDDGACDAPLRAVKGRPTTRCKVCGAEWDVEERRAELLAQANDVQVTAVEATWVLPIETRRITDWARAGHLDPVGQRNGRPVYALAHIARLHHLSKHGQRLSNITKESA